MFRDKVEPDASGIYWGDPQKVHLKEKCTGTVVALAKVYRAPPNVEAIKDRGKRNYQFNKIVLCKVQWAETQDCEHQDKDDSCEHVRCSQQPWTK